MIDDHLLKILGSHSTIKASRKLRLKRNRFVRAFLSVVSYVNAVRNRMTYTCQGTEDLPGKLLLTENSQNTDNLEALIVHKNIGIAYDFFLKVLKINSLDDKGMPLVSSVDYSQNYENAFWNSSQMVYGSGSPHFKAMGRALDISCHELGHGITEKLGPNLVYVGESGALNEAFSDILGISCKHWNTQDTDPLESNWLLGDEIITPAFPGKAIRSFKNEHAYDGDNQPKFRINYVKTLSDNGGVHTNSGIINHLFYRICINLKSPSYLDPIQLIWATHKKLWQHSNFDDFKKKLIATSAEMFGQDSSKHQTVLSTIKDVGF